MDDNTGNKSSKRNLVSAFAGWCLGILYLALCVIVVAFGSKQAADKNSPTPTATITPIPHILVSTPPAQIKVMHEDFSSNQRDWGLYFEYGKLQVINGKLILQSNVPNGIAVGTSNQLSTLNEKYYIQADFSTDNEKASYGLIFGLNKSLATYYLFETLPQSTGFALLKFNSGKWTELIPFSRAEMNHYPQANTLSVYFDKGHMELYINGELVTDYSDKDFFQSNDIGVFVNNTGYRLFVDDFFVYDEK